MSYPYRSHQVLEILGMPKCLPAGTKMDVDTSGKEQKGAEFDTRPELKDGGFLDMRYLGKAPRLDDPCTYDATFLLANHRVRGIGYCAVERNNLRFKRRIPKGWHLNVCDPTQPTNHELQNIHKALENFQPTDFVDFINRTAEIWSVDLGWEWEGELF